MLPPPSVTEIPIAFSDSDSETLQPSPSLFFNKSQYDSALQEVFDLLNYVVCCILLLGNQALGYTELRPQRLFYCILL